MARVFLARLRGPGGFEKRLVVKQILPKFAREPAFVDMFVREANTLVQMSHPHIVPVYELGVVDGVYFLALEWVEGVTLKELMRRGELQPEMVVHVGAQICEALRYAFGRFQVVHRDVTPRNIMVDRDGHARLLDFGIAASVADTGGGDLFGSAGFMSPEQLRGDPLDARTDLFALGAVLYEGLCGGPAFPDRNAARKAETLGVAAVPGDDIDAELSALVMRMLSPDPEGRPADAAEAGKQLRGWLASRRPDGVAQDLGLQVTQVQAKHPRALGFGDSDAPDATDGAGDEPSGSGDGSGPEVQTIATSVDLDQLIEQATQPIERTVPDTEGPAPDSTQPIESRPPPESTQPIARDAGDAHGASPPTAEPGTEAGRRGAARFVWPLLTVLVAAGLWFADAGSPPASRDDEVGRAAPVAEPPPPAVPAATRDAGPRVQPAGDSPATGRAAAPAATRRAKRDGGTAAPGPRRGRLSVNALPWGTVQIDGREVGNTPLRNHPLPAGKHTVRIECPPLGRVATTRVDVPAGGSARILVDLNREPPAITLGGR